MSKRSHRKRVGLAAGAGISDAMAATNMAMTQQSLLGMIKSEFHDEDPNLLRAAVKMEMMAHENEGSSANDNCFVDQNTFSQEVQGQKEPISAVKKPVTPVAAPVTAKFYDNWASGSDNDMFEVVSEEEETQSQPLGDVKATKNSKKR